MHVVISGGTGFIGQALVKRLVQAGHRVTILTRSAQQSEIAGARLVQRRPGSGWEQELDGAAAVVNLSGESIGGRRWSPAQKVRIVQSRTEGTRELVAALARAQSRPKVLVSGSAVGYYGDRHEPISESAPPGTDFLAQTCLEWEQAAQEAEVLGIRVVRLRTGVVLGKGGGALGRMLLPFRLFAGGPIGSGRQAFPWIHLADVIGLIEFALQNPAVSGPLNAVAPERVNNAAFSRALGKVMRRPCWLPVPAFVLRLALGEMADNMLLMGQAAVPAAAQRFGYRFAFPQLSAALQDVLQ